jgi:hypothetical protein
VIMKQILLGLVVLFGISHANAETLEDLAGLYAECTAYYTFVYHAVNNSGYSDTAATYSKVMDDSMFYSLLLASETREKDMAVNVTNARIEMYLKQMKRETNNDNANISILINKHNFTCQDAMKNPPVELIDILKRRINEVP